ncbi:MAG: flagellar protein FlgN [Cycloclasticus sp.]|nr:flagellar protein FlgN [Cycloclasticus sp.]
MNDLNHLTQLLETLENTSTLLNEALKQETVILNASNSEALITVSSQKKSLVSQLEKQTKVLHIFLVKKDVKEGLYGLESLLNSIKTKEPELVVHQLWTSIQILINNNKELNYSNGSIIELNKRYTQRAIDVLQGKSGLSHHTYGADGLSTTSPLSRNINTA